MSYIFLALPPSLYDSKLIELYRVVQKFQHITYGSCLEHNLEQKT
jgi:hypothetical protein